MSNIPEILKSSKTIAVVGLSANPMRVSNGVTEYMQCAGYRIIPVNPNESKVLGEKSYARLEDVPEKIDIVNVFSEIRIRRGCGGFRGEDRREDGVDAGRRGR